MNLGAVNTLIFDLDGVVWRGNSPIEGAVEAIAQFKAAGKRCLYCTNNSSQTPAAFVEKLAGLGIEAVEDDIITSSTATALYLSAQYTGPFLAYVVGGEGIHTAIQKIGARIVYDRDIEDDTKVDCVIAGIDRSFTYEKLNTAQRLIRSGALFVATNRDATYPVEHGVIPGAGSIVAAIEAASNTTPVTIGKPRPVMIQLVQQKFKIAANEIAFIGDRLDTDVVCARRAGVASILVLTGVTTLQQARRAKGELRPDAVFPDLPSLVGVVLDNSPGAALDLDELPSYEGTKASAEPVTLGAPREEASFLPITEEPAAGNSQPPNSEASADSSFAFSESTPEADSPEASPSEAQNTPPVVEDAAQPAAESPTDVEAGSLSAFSFDTAVTKEEETETAAEAAPVAEDSTTPAASGDSTEWDDNWFAEASSEQNGSANGEAEASQSTPAEESSKAEEDKATTSSSGFEWKLD